MDKLLYLLGPLACAGMMVVCMALMGRGMRRDRPQDTDESDEIAALRAEVAELRAERTRAGDG